MLSMMMNWDTGTWTVVLIFSVPIIAIITQAWVSVERSRSENDLKRSMIERGMSVEEIERVINSQTPKR
jgi:hypothetical protein